MKVLETCISGALLVVALVIIVHPPARGTAAGWCLMLLLGASLVWDVREMRRTGLAKLSLTELYRRRPKDPPYAWLPVAMAAIAMTLNALG